MTTDRLEVLMSGQRAGHMTRAAKRGALLSFEYSETYVDSPTAVPLSVSMPMQQRNCTGETVDGWLAGLLPGHSQVRNHWAAKYGAASSEPFHLLSTKMGLECAGAVQFCVPGTCIESLQAGDVDWLTPGQTTEMVADMVRQGTLWGRQLRRSAFSLAGAYAKTALYRDDANPRRWGEPHGSQPSTHILKVPMPNQPEQSVNEHLCLATARHAGLATALSELQTWGEHKVVIVRRFDRIREPDGALLRVHQEDLHQAAGNHKASIYQNDDPDSHSPASLARILSSHSTEPARDIAGFFDALAYNWLICNTDAHAKNYSIFLGPNTVRLAPLYDIWSIMPEDPHHYESWSLAMSVLEDRRILAAASREAWRETARAVGLNPTEGVERVERVAGALPAAFERAVDELDPEHRSARIVRELSAMIPNRVSNCLSALTGAVKP